MLINLVPDFLAVLRATDPEAAYRRYVDANRRILEPYWMSYVLGPGDEGESAAAADPLVAEEVRRVVTADYGDLRAMLARTDVVALAREAEARCTELLAADVGLDVVLMVGVGAANAGELVSGGRGIAFVCLEHFTGVANPETHGLGLDPSLLPLWLAHEIAHVVRYTSPGSRAELRQLVDEAGGSYDYWQTGKAATLRELLVNEGLAVETARAASPGRAEWEYFGYDRAQYARIRELEGTLAHTVARDLDHAGLGFRLRYLSDGLSEAARTVSLPAAGSSRMVLPERFGYYLGAAMVQPAVAERGLAWAVRASAAEIMAVARAALSA